MQPPLLSARPETAADFEAIHRVTAAAFERAEEADLVDALRASESWLDLSYVAEAAAEASTGAGDEAAAGEIIAHAMLSRCFVGDVPGVCLAPCSVVPEHQRAGAGTAVIETVLAEAVRRGEAYAVVLGHAEYYPRFGFTRASGFGITLHVEVPDEALMAMPLASDVPAGALRFAPEFGV